MGCGSGNMEAVGVLQAEMETLKGRIAKLEATILLPSSSPINPSEEIDTRDLLASLRQRNRTESKAVQPPSSEELVARRVKALQFENEELKTANTRLRQIIANASALLGIEP
jgi:hypothetical protein